VRNIDGNEFFTSKAAGGVLRFDCCRGSIRCRGNRCRRRRCVRWLDLGAIVRARRDFIRGYRTRTWASALVGSRLSAVGARKNSGTCPAIPTWTVVGPVSSLGHASIGAGVAPSLRRFTSTSGRTCIPIDCFLIGSVDCSTLFAITRFGVGVIGTILASLLSFYR